MRKTCPGCETDFSSVRSNQKFCSRKCGVRIQTRARLNLRGPVSISRPCRWCRETFSSPDGRRDYCSAGCARFGELLREVQAKYGITKDAYRDLHFAQNGKCAVCREAERSVRNTLLAVDHDHVTGQVRGLLCSHCNRAIGLLGDDPEVIAAAAAYVAHNRAMKEFAA